MRKRYLFHLMAILLFATSFTTDRHSSTARHLAGKRAFDPKDWLIDEATASRMMIFYRDCKGGKCKPFKKHTVNSEAEDYIKENYTIIKAEPLMARYSEADEPRYRRARGLAADDPRGAVDGYSTVITRYRVQSKDKLLFAPPMSLYVDNATICPPPDTCD
jgi:hypothetical protein